MIAFPVYALVVLLSLAAVALNIFSLPGNWLMMLTSACLAWSTGWTRPSPSMLATMVILLLLGECVEIAGSILGAKTFGASRGAAWAAIAGAVIGAIIGTPVWIIGNLLGAILGAFAAAWLVELLNRRGLKTATWAAVGAALGRTVGITVKLFCGILAWVILIIFAWPA